MTTQMNEPWTFEQFTRYFPDSLIKGFGFRVKDQENVVVSEAFPQPYPVAVSEDVARRIAACVNACAGIPTEALEQLVQYAHGDGARLTYLAATADKAARELKVAQP